jgi:hypothetical protein
MALYACGIGIDSKRVGVGRLVILVLRGALLHVTVHALICEPQRMGCWSVFRWPGGELADVSEENVILRRMMWSAPGTGPRSAAMIMALGANIDFWIVLIDKGAGGGDEVIVGGESGIEELSRVARGLVGVVARATDDRNVGIAHGQRLAFQKALVD